MDVSSLPDKSGSTMGWFAVVYKYLQFYIYKSIYIYIDTPQKGAGATYHLA